MPSNLTPTAVWRGSPISPEHQPNPEEIVTLFQQFVANYSDEASFASSEEVYVDGALGVISGRAVLFNLTGSGDLANSGGVQAFYLDKRTSVAVQYFKDTFADLVPFVLEGQSYCIDSSLADALSATADLSITKVKPHLAPRREHYGVLGNDVSATAATEFANLQRMADYCKDSDQPFTIDDGGVYAFAGTLDLRDIRRVNVGSVMRRTTDDLGVLTGNTDRTNLISESVDLKEVYYSGSSTEVDVRIQGTRATKFYIYQCNKLEHWADGNVPAENSSYYSEIRFGIVNYLVLNGTNGGFLNEGEYVGKVSADLTVDGSYAFNNVNMEQVIFDSSDPITININTGGGITIRSRFECAGGMVITCAAGTYGNKFIRTYLDGEVSENAPYTNWANNVTLVNNGDPSNEIVMDHQARKDRKLIATFSPETPIFNGGSIFGPCTLVRGLKTLGLTGAGIFWTSDRIPMQEGVSYIFALEDQIFRPYVYVYDADGKPVTGVDPAVGVLISGGSWNAAGHYTFTDDTGGLGVHTEFALRNASSGGYIALGLEANTTQFERASIWAVEQIADLRNAERATPVVQHTPVVSASPTEGRAVVGQQVITAAGTRYTCIRALDTNLTNAAASGATSVVLDSVSGIASGDIIGVELDDNSTHWTKVSGTPSGSTVALTIGLTDDAAASNMVWSGAWA